MKFLHLIPISLGILLLITVNSCKTIPEHATPVRPFNKTKYLGKWYEIARFDYRFEKNLNNVTAEYSLKPDGSIKVDNKGYDFVAGKWKKSIGKAKFAASEDEGKLLVSFFGPFYSGYNVIAVDDQYHHALIAGKNLKYLWLLSRSKQMPEAVKKNYLQIAKDLGYEIENLVWVEQNDGWKYPNDK